MNVVPMSVNKLSQQATEVASLMKDFTVETTPTSAAKMADFREVLRPGATVYITFLPGSDYNDTVATAKRLRDEGFEPAPHFAARSIESRAQFEDYLARATGEAGVDHILTIAGALKAPLGPYADSMQLLETGLFDKYGIKNIGVAGHPEGSPDMSDEAIAEAIAWKNGFAERTDADLHILTQFCFEAAPIIAWDKKLNIGGNKLPIRIGAPGIAKISTLLNYAMACGIGNSVQFIKKQARNVTKLMKVQAPDALLTDLARYKANDTNCGIDGVHMYPLGGLRKTAAWSYAVEDGAITPNGDGFSVNVDIG